MYNKFTDVTTFTREQAVDYIKNHCRDCEIRMNCSGYDSMQCQTKIEYLLDKYESNLKETN